ncbi:MAG TPA: DinB family protein [Terriglobales bacterium]
MTKDNHDQAVRQHLLDLLKGGNAHVKFDEVVRDFPEGLRGKKPEGQPHTAWRLLEHMRIAQWDIVEFSRSSKHVSPEFPDGYWPKGDTPPSATAWEKSVKQFRADLKAMQDLVADPKTELYARIPWGDGQTVLREALLVADHNAYHLGELLMIRRLLGAWKG